jgi:hypothetical protein
MDRLQFVKTLLTQRTTIFLCPSTPRAEDKFVAIAYRRFAYKSDYYRFN